MHEIFENEPPLDIPELMLARCVVGMIFELRTSQVNEKRRNPTSTFEIALNKLKPYIFIYRHIHYHGAQKRSACIKN